MAQAHKPAVVRKAISKVLDQASHIQSTKTVHIHSSDDDAVRKLATDESPLLVPARSVNPANSAAEYSPEEARAISQCEMSLPSCETVALTGQSPLVDWMNAWSEAGMLNGTVSAMLGDLSDLLCMLGRHRTKLSEIPERKWPVLGLRSQLEAERLEMNQLVRLGQRDVRGKGLDAQSTSYCLHQGTMAPLIFWIRFWLTAGMMKEVAAAVSGIGIRQLPGTYISHCEMEAASFHISLFISSTQRRQKPGYVLSGYWFEGTPSTFAYHPHTRDQIPSIDANNWHTGHRLGITRQQNGSHPIALIGNVLGDGLAGISGQHCMGLLVKALGSEGEGEDQPLSVVDVVGRLSLLDSINSPTPFDSVARRRMPGVFPATWICMPAVNEDASSTEIWRPANSAEVSWNLELHWLATEVLLPGTERSSFRSTKWETERVEAGETYCMRYPARGFVAHERLNGTVLSAFRLPLGSLIGSVLALNGDTRHCLEQTISQVITALRDLLAQPEEDLSALLDWIVFDSMAGTLEQMPYRYQVVLGENGFTLECLPYWSLPGCSDLPMQTQLDFGFQMSLDDESVGRLLSETNLSVLAATAKTDLRQLISFVQSCQKAFNDSGLVIRGAHTQQNIQTELAEPFRSAKWNPAEKTNKATA